MPFVLGVDARHLDRVLELPVEESMLIVQIDTGEIAEVRLLTFLKEDAPSIENHNSSLENHDSSLENHDLCDRWCQRQPQYR